MTLLSLAPGVTTIQLACDDCGRVSDRCDGAGDLRRVGPTAVRGAIRHLLALEGWGLATSYDLGEPTVVDLCPGCVSKHQHAL
jgi:hypothetical protein